MELRPGMLLGPYCLVEPAGQDGPVEIWLAKQLGLIRPVDIAFFPTDDGSRPGYLERFRSEATRLVRLNHPNILTMRDFGVLDGRPYLVTPRVGGLTLNWLLGEAWPLNEAREVIDPLASALDYLHARGVVHRDLRPTRVLVSDAAQPVLIGFGAGWLVEESRQHAATADESRLGPSIVATGVIAPEQARGGPASPASDRYALGRIAFELLLGRPPFDTEVWPAELEPPGERGLRAPSTLSTDLLPAVVAVLHQALAQDPADRFATGRELTRGLDAADPPPQVAAAAASPEPSLATFLAGLTSPGPRVNRWHNLFSRLTSERTNLMRLMGALAALAVMGWFFVLQPALAMLGGRGGHAAVSLTGGEVLLIGGCANVPADGSAAAFVRGLRYFGAKDPGAGVLDSTLLFGAPQSSWSSGGRLGQARCDARAAPLANGGALVVGGTTVAGQPLATAERYDRLVNGWTPAGKLLIPRKEYAMTPLGTGQVLVSGGASISGGSEFLPSAERYDPATVNWSLTSRMTDARRQHSAILMPDGQVLVTGGLGSAGTLASAERWDPTTNTWSPAGTIQQPRARHTATLLASGQVLLVGGAGERPSLASAERYDLASGSSSRTASMREARVAHTATLLPDGQVLIVAGTGLNGPLATAERYDPATNSWSSAGSLSRARSGHTATLLPNGTVLVAGGRSEAATNPYVESVELYDPVANSWSLVANLPP